MRTNMTRLSTIIQDKKVLALRRKGWLRKEIALKLFLSIDQVRHAERRMKIIIENVNSFESDQRNQKI